MDKNGLTLVVDNTEADVQENTDKMEGWMAGQAQAFQAGRQIEEHVSAVDKSAAFKASFLVGFLSYYHTMFEQMRAEAEAQFPDEDTTTN